MKSFRSFYFYLMKKTSQKYPERTTWFIGALIFIFIFSTFSFNIDYTEMAQRNENGIPGWYFYLIFSVDVLMIISQILIFFYRKVGIYLFPVAVFTHFLLHNFYLSSFLYFDLMLLFFYFAIILFMTIPRWKYFK